MGVIFQLSIWLVGAVPIPDVSVDAIIARLEKTEAAIRNLTVSTEYVKLQQYTLPVEKPVRMMLTTKFIVDSRGWSWYDCTGEQVNVGADGVRTYKGRWQCAYDGHEATSLTGDAHGVFHSGGRDDHPSWHGVNPLEFTTHYFQKPLTKILREGGAKVVGHAQHEGRRVVIVETTPIGENQQRCYRFLVDIERWVVVRRAIQIRFTPEQKWQEYSRIECREYKEVQPGIWLPLWTKYESVDVTADLAPEKLSWSYEGRHKDWVVNADVPEATFRLTFPAGVVVTDRRAKKEGK